MRLTAYSQHKPFLHRSIEPLVKIANYIFCIEKCMSEFSVVAVIEKNTQQTDYLYSYCFVKMYKLTYHY